MEVEGHPGLIKTIGPDDEVENFSEESDEEIEVLCFNLKPFQFYWKTSF